MRRLLIITISVSALAAAGCRNTTPRTTGSGNTNSTPTAPPRPATTPDDSAPQREPGPTLGTEPIEYRGYQLTREVRMEKSELMGVTVETEYAVLKFGNTVVKTFDAYLGMTGNKVGFGLFPLLGQEHKQMVIKLDLYRESEAWVIDLYPRLRLIYHSSDYGFSGPLAIRDIDHDGVSELTTPVSDYDMFAGLPVCCSPDVTVILKYYQRSKKFIPANNLFPDEVVRKNAIEMPLIHAGKNELDHVMDRLHILNIVFRYLYAGQEREGWEFFEKEFNEPDKADVRQDLKQKLTQEPIFQFLHPHRTSEEALQ